MITAVLFVVYTGLFLFLFKKLAFFKVCSLKFLVFIFILKLLCGFAVAYIYSHNYSGGDTFSYMRDVRWVFSFLKKSPAAFFQFVFHMNTNNPDLQTIFTDISSFDIYEKWGDKFLVLRLNAFLCLFTFGAYPLHIVFMAFFSMTGLVAIYKTALKISNSPNYFLLGSVFFLPSAMLWSSGVLKEPFLILFLGLNVFALNNLLNRFNIFQAVIVLATGVLFYQLKPFLFIALLPGYASWILCGTLKNARPVVVFLACYVVIILSLQILAYTSSINIFQMISDQQMAGMKDSIRSSAKSILPIINFSPDLLGLMKYMPYALYRAFLVPSMMGFGNILQLLVALENLLVVAFIIFMISKIEWQKVIQEPFILFACTCGLSVLLLVAFTTPIAGSLVRLKMPGTFLLLTGLSCATKPFRFRKS